MTTWTDAELLAEIETYQRIQKTNKCGNPMWNKASVCLRELYAEMAKRHPSKK